MKDKLNKLLPTKEQQASVRPFFISLIAYISVGFGMFEMYDFVVKNPQVIPYVMGGSVLLVILVMAWYAFAPTRNS